VEQFFTFVLSGAVSGAIYSLIASGLVLSYTSTGIFNFSYGAVAYTSAFLYYELHTGLHWPIVPAAILVVLVFAPLFGLLLNVAVFRPLARATVSGQIMATIGLLVAIPALTRWITDELVKIFNWVIPTSDTIAQVVDPPGIGPVPRTEWHLFGTVPFDSDKLIVLIAAAICAVLLWVLMRLTPLGLQMRAVVDRAPLARTRGVDDAMTSRYAWIIGMVLAALAGVVGQPIIHLIDQGLWLNATFIAAAAAVLGGLRSIPLAFIGGLLLGILTNLVAGYAAPGEFLSFAKDIHGFNASVPTLILLVGLVLLAVSRTRRGGTTADDTPPPDYLAALPLWRRALPWTLLTLFLVGQIFVWASPFWLGNIAGGLALAIVFMSFVVVTGMGGMVTLAQATFVTMAGLTFGMMLNTYGWAFFPAALVAIAATVVLGVIVALPGLRLGGIPFALATVALALLGDQLLFQIDDLRNGQSGWTITRMKIDWFDSLGLHVDLADNRAFAVFMLLLVFATMFLIANLKRSSWGRSIAAVRSSDIAASTSGVSIVRTKLGLFAVSAAIAGVGGVFYASYQQAYTNVTTPTTIGLVWLATVVLFGIRRPAAAALAGVTSLITAQILQFGFTWSWIGLHWKGLGTADFPPILFGLGAVQLARNPDGFLAVMAEQRLARKLKREARRAAPVEAPAPGVPLAPAALGSDDGVDAVIREEEAAIAAETERHERELLAAGVLRSSGESVDFAGAALAVRGLHAGYGEVEVLHGVDLVVRSGEITALLGANGSGKSTLCSTISGLVAASKGSIELDGRDITSVSAHHRARQGVLVAPESRGIFPGLSVEENLVLRLNPKERSEVYERFPILGERRKLAAGSLSGGEQQMLTLGAVLARPPAVLVADEPTLGLAPLVVAELMHVFEELRARDVAILLVEEKARDVLEVADRVAFLELGHLVWSGPRAEIDDERLVATYLGSGTS